MRYPTSCAICLPPKIELLQARFGGVRRQLVLVIETCRIKAISGLYVFLFQ